MFDRFSERARKSMSLARQEALRFHHDYIGTEHVLLGVVKEESGVAAQVLKNRGITPPRICDDVEKIVREGTHRITWGQLPFTPRAKRVLELSLESAQELGHDYIGTEHLLLGLVREGEGIGADVLRHLGVTPDVVRADVLGLLGSRMDEDRAPAERAAGAGRAPVADLWQKSDAFAREMGHSCVGTEHLLIAILEIGGPAADALAAAGVKPDVARAAVEKLRGRRTTRRSGVDVRASPRMMEALRGAGERGGPASVRTDQILLALLQIEDGLAVTALRGLSVDLAALRADVTKRLDTK